MPNPGDVITYSNCPCCGSSSSSSSSNIFCCSFDPSGLNCVFNRGLGYVGNAACVTSPRFRATITAASTFGTFSLGAFQCNNWTAIFCTTSGSPTYIVAQITNNIWTVIWPCPGIIGTCAGSNYSGSAACAGTGQTIALSNAGVVTANCPATLSVTLTW